MSKLCEERGRSGGFMSQHLLYLLSITRSGWRNILPIRHVGVQGQGLLGFACDFERIGRRPVSFVRMLSNN
jgi:hypothetical protein